MVTVQEEMERMLRLKDIDPEIYQTLASETRRQEERCELIASENIVSRAVMETLGSVMTNKYAEGYPGRRFYAGCSSVDVAEELARCRAKDLFGAEHVNVQPHAGAPANTAVYLALLKPGSRILGMALSHGGHLTHGSSGNISGKFYAISTYGVDPETNLLDMEEVRQIAIKVKPHLIVAGASSYPRIIDFKRFREIADEAGAYFMADIAHIAGLVVSGLHPSPVEHAHFVTTTTHKTLRGPRGGMIMCQEKFAEAIDRAVFPGLQGGPMMHVIAAKAVALKEAATPEFRRYQKRVVENAMVLAESLQELDYKVVTGGTDNHLVLIDLQNKNITGREMEKILEIVGITANKNTIPFDERPPHITSGLRLGTPTVTTRGMGVAEMKKIAKMINEALVNRDDQIYLAKLQRQITEMCTSFPLFY